jgi:hypothetical protein
MIVTPRWGRLLGPIPGQGPSDRAPGRCRPDASTRVSPRRAGRRYTHDALGDRRGAVARRLGAAFLAFIDSRSSVKPLLMPLAVVLAAVRQTGRMKIQARAV